ncbi:MAG: hypothetical protein QOG73_4885, partial [Acetobacteraceae bacterium]|nr:hypothetical protein [Acetobacteraceae bacterium]
MLSEATDFIPRAFQPLPALRRGLPLADRGSRAHPLGMFVVSETEADAIRATFVQRGELSAAIELRRLCPGITNNVQARACARTIAGWKPLPTTKLRSVTLPRT